MANQPVVSPFPVRWCRNQVAAEPAGGRGGRGGGGRGAGAPEEAAGGGGRGGRGGPAAGAAAVDDRPRVVLRFPTDTSQMLLSGVLVGGSALSGRAQLVDTPLGNGHVVSFSIRPYWRWQTHGTYIFGFNAILNWNDLQAGRPGAPRGASDGQGRGETR